MEIDPTLQAILLLALGGFGAYLMSMLRKGIEQRADAGISLARIWERLEALDRERHDRQGVEKTVVRLETEVENIGREIKALRHDWARLFDLMTRQQFPQAATALPPLSTTWGPQST